MKAVLLIAFILGRIHFADAQQATRGVTVGELLFRDPTRLVPGRRAFHRQLHELGYVEGKTYYMRRGRRAVTLTDFICWLVSWPDLKLTYYLRQTPMRPLLLKPRRKQFLLSFTSQVILLRMDWLRA